MSEATRWMAGLALWSGCAGGALVPDDKVTTGDDTGADTASENGGNGGNGANGGDTEPVDTSGGDNGSNGGDSDTQDSGETGETGDSTVDPPPPVPVRFVVLGDGGEGNDTQYQVADAMLAVCATKDDDLPGCAFALYLGDNFYDDGVSSVDDEQFETKFELPYEDLSFPFYVVLGNHDYGQLSLLGYKADYEVAYSARSAKWTMPDHYYDFDVENVHFIGLDTNQIMLESLWGDSGQGSWIDGRIASSTADWQLAFGHHPYRSNGAHGNAGEYEGYEWLPIANGATVESFMDDHFCGQVDVYFAGHDHNRQWLDPYCGVDLFISGAAAKTTDLEDRGNGTSFQDDSVAGFMWVEIAGLHMHVEIYDAYGTLDFSGDLYR